MNVYVKAIIVIVVLGVIESIVNKLTGADVIIDSMTGSQKYLYSLFEYGTGFILGLMLARK